MSKRVFTFFLGHSV